jgi:Cys-tRNA(Pro)/Cys-tRNA(Cys) deacylase
VTAIGTRATELIRRAGVDHRLHAYEAPDRHGRARDGRPAFGSEAAAALGVAPERIFKTLVAAVDDRLVLAVVPVARELDLKRLADACGGRRADLADPTAAERATGYVIGGISPLGSRRALVVIVDVEANRHPTVFVSAGRRGLQVELAPDDLIRLAGALVASIARDY